MRHPTRAPTPPTTRSSLPPTQEDAIIAYTWQHFVEKPDEPEWLLRLPMTKAAIRAMDTIEVFFLPPTVRDDVARKERFAPRK